MNITKAQLEAYREKLNNILRQSHFNPEETSEEQTRRIDRAKKDYAYFVETYFPHYAKVACAPFHSTAANKIRKNKDLRAVFEWARGHAKSTHMTILVPLWLKINKDIKTMVLVGKSENSAVTLLSDLQAELEANQLYLHDFGEQVSVGDWQEGEFVTRDGCAFFARGRGQSPRGLRKQENRPDYIVIDDLDDEELCRNERRVREMVDWVLEALFGALDMGSGRFIMVGNKIHKNAVLANIATRPGVFHTRVNALDKNGNPSWGAKYTLAEIQSAIDFMGYRRSQKEFFNNPIVEGTVFKDEYILYKKMPALDKYEYLICYTDPSFKGTTKNDYKATWLLGKIGREIHGIKAFCRQTSVRAMVQFAYDLEESKPQNTVIPYYMEANFLQDLLLDEYVEEGDVRGYQLPIRGDKRDKPDKFSRIEAMSPLFERGFVFFNEAEKDKPDMKVAIEQFLAIEKGSSTADDAPDAFEGGLYYLQRYTRSGGKNKLRTGKYNRTSDRNPD
jgi:hypothetical protein